MIRTFGLGGLGGLDGLWGLSASAFVRVNEAQKKREGKPSQERPLMASSFAGCSER